MSPGSNTENYPAFAHIGLRENPGKNLNQVTCPRPLGSAARRTNRYSTATTKNNHQQELDINISQQSRKLLKDIPPEPRRLAVASFRLNTEHDILGKHLNRLGTLPSASCILCHQQEDLDRHLAKCPALKSSKEINRYWEARARMFLITKSIVLFTTFLFSAQSMIEEKKELAGSLAEKKLSTIRCTGRNGRKVRDRRSYQMIDDIEIQMDRIQRLRRRQNIEEIGECWIYSERLALGQKTMKE
ncbi:hypothetical protein ANN_11649 [Periplaneta americana]|uniref:Uncharacterized protein n=1 Tax=Periplaneta americana TaxID=6978 RepID=A0ABQ8T5M9_PERAM|nr:hypothetical protein ANN_11649 [Periplaneta americana]